MLTASPQQGFSLVELMLASVLSLTLLAAALHLHRLNATAFAHVEARYRLLTELDHLLERVLAEARRAGFNAGHLPHHSLSGRVLVLGAAPGEPARSCLLYAYDRNGDGRLGVGKRGRARPGANRTNMEQFGFRLRRRRLQIRLGGERHGCDSGVWADLSPPGLEILLFHLERFDVGDPPTPRLAVKIRGRIGNETLDLEGESWLPNA